MFIELMTAEDLPQVLEIERQSFPLPFSENLFRMELELNVAHLIVAKDDSGKVLGYLDFWHVETEMHVINIASSPQARRQGVGRMMMNYLVDYAIEKNAEQIFLDVRESNKAAIALYRKFGFFQIDVRRGYYQDNEEDALVMLKQINKEKK